MDGPWWLRNAGYSSLHSSSETGSQITTSRSIQLVIFAIFLIYPLYGYYQRRLSYQVSFSSRILVIWYGTGTDFTYSLTKRSENNMAVFLWITATL